MPSVALTDRFVASVTAPESGRLDVFDKQESGLILRVSGEGRKTWAVRYRTLDGRQPRFTLGTYPATGLRKARELAQDAKRAAERGGDPAGEARKARATAKQQPIRTFADLSAAYLVACERGEWAPKGKKKRPRTLADDRAVYRRYVEQEIGARPLAEITRPVVKGLLRKLVARGINAQANRTQAFIRQVYSYAISEWEGGLVAVNPATGFAPLGESRPRTRTLTDDELRRLWAALCHPGELKITTAAGAETKACLGREVAIVLQLCAILLQRKGEIVGMRVAELDLDRALWLIPGERMKNGRQHLVPLPLAAVDLIREALALREDPGSPVVFPSPRDAARAIRADSVSHAMRGVVLATGIPDASPHDLRRTGATALTSERLGVQPFIRSKVLAHSGDAGGGAAVSMIHYDANEYVSEKRRALEAWSALLLAIVQTPSCTGGSS